MRICPLKAISNTVFSVCVTRSRGAIATVVVRLVADPLDEEVYDRPELPGKLILDSRQGSAEQKQLLATELLANHAKIFLA